MLNVEIGDDSFDIFYDSLGICSMEREQKSKNLRMGTIKSLAQRHCSTKRAGYR